MITCLCFLQINFTFFKESDLFICDPCLLNLYHFFSNTSEYSILSRATCITNDSEQKTIVYKIYHYIQSNTQQLLKTEKFSKSSESPIIQIKALGNPEESELLTRIRIYGIRTHAS